MLGLVTILTFAITPVVGEDAWLMQAISMMLTTLAFGAPPVCGKVARGILDRARVSFDQHFPRGDPERRLARRALGKREDDWNGTLAEDMQTRS